MKKSILTQCLQFSVNKFDRHPFIKDNRRKFLHWSFIVQNNTIIEYGTNVNIVPPIHMGYNTRIDGYDATVHSEINVYHRGKALLDGKPFEIVNVRLGKDRKIRMSKPCVCCHNILTELGCARFYYSSEIGFLKT